MAKIGVFLVGIGAYSYGGQSSSFPPLKFPKADVDGIEAYVSACWARSERCVVRVEEGDATLAGLERGFATLARGGPYDLQLVFLSGHGLVEPTRRGYLLQPSEPLKALSLLEPVTIDRFLALSKAKRTVLILDCCYAEAIVGQLQFFSALGNDRARLFIGSSRATQETWEDEKAGHGVFTAHLLDLLNTGSSASLSNVRDALDVDGELFPILCSQVPLYVLEHKQAEQEPVKGGLASASVTLPVARATRRIKERTPLGTALRRLRQIAFSLAGVGAAFLVFAYSMLYYIEPDPSGTLVVRHGTRWLDPIFRYLAPTRVDTGISASELSTNPSASYPLLAGHTTGVWTHTSLGHYRSWYDTISAGLAPDAAKRFNVLVGLAGPSPASQLGEQSRPSEVAFAAWAALAQNRPQDLDLVLKHLPGADRLVAPALGTFDPNRMDFTILDQTAKAMQSFAQAISYAATLDPVRTLPAYVGFAKATREWLAHNSDAQRGRDAQAHVRTAVADCLGVIARARVDRGLSALDPATITLLETLSHQGYAEVIDAALSRAKGTPQASAAATRQLAAFHGDPNDPVQNKALEVIMVSLDDSAQYRDIVDQVVARFQKAGNGENSYLSRLLIEAADARALSPGLVVRLIADAKRSLAKPDRDFMDSERARVLSHAMSLVTAADQPNIYRLIELVAKDVTPMAGATAEMYATLGRQRLDLPGMLEHVSVQARLAKPYTPVDPGAVNESMPGMVIVVGRGPWVAALAQYGRNRHLPDADVAVLRNHLADPALRLIVLKALVEQERLRAPDAFIDLWVSNLGTMPRNAQDRKVWQDVIAQALASLPRQPFIAAIEGIRAARDIQREPELRLALGPIVADAQIWRVNPPDRGHGLFD